MDVLPDEILTIILEYSLSNYTDYINLSQVSSTWYNICAYILNKFSNVIGVLRKPVDFEELEKIIRGKFKIVKKMVDKNRMVGPENTLR